MSDPVCDHYKNRMRLAVILVLQIIFIVLFQNFLLPNFPETLNSKKQNYQALVKNSVAADNKTEIILSKIKNEKLPEMSHNLLLTIPENCPLPIGAEIRFSAGIKKPKNFQNPGAFDYKRHLANQKIWGKVFVPHCDQITVIKTNPLNFFARKRQKIDQKIAEASLTHPDLIRQLLFGTKSFDTEQKTQIREAGLSHLFAISGMNFALMVFFLSYVFDRLWYYSPLLTQKIPRQKIVALSILAFLIFYLMIAESCPSLQRAGFMMTLFFLSVIFERERKLIKTLLLSAILILILRPADIFDVSFQLSYLSVLFLIIIFPLLESKLKKQNLFPQNILLRFIIEMSLLSFCLTIFLIPYLLATFGEITLAGLFHNIWAIPFFQFLITPLSLLFLFLAIFNLPGTALCLQVWDRFLDAFFFVLEKFPFEFLKPLLFFKPHDLHIFLFYAAVFLFFLFKRKIFSLILSLTLLLSIGVTFYQNHLNYDLKITQIDVGQGDSALIQTRDKNLLIDTGGHAYLDIGKLVLLSFLKHKWVQKIDVVILTHSDIDHYLGLKSLLGKIPIQEVWVASHLESDIEFQNLLTSLETYKIKLKKITAPENIFLDTNTHLKILAPTKDFLNSANDNDHSLVVQLQHNSFRALFTGDLSRFGEIKLTQTYKDTLQSTLLKVGHHGSKTSSSPLFLSYVNPKIAVIGVGQKSHFGHPAKEVLERFENRKIPIYRTDKHGAIETRVSGDKIKISVYKN